MKFIYLFSTVVVESRSHETFLILSTIYSRDAPFQDEELEYSSSEHKNRSILDRFLVVVGSRSISVNLPIREMHEGHTCYGTLHV